MKHLPNEKNIFPEGFDFNDAQAIETACIVYQVAFMHTGLIWKFVRQINYPIAYLDIKTLHLKTPIYPGCGPNQHIPYQFSLHLEEKIFGENLHFHFLGNPANDPRELFLDRLIKTSRHAKSILVFNKSFTVARLNELIKHFPDQTPAIESILSRMIDLKLPFQKRWYYDPFMIAGTGLKSMLMCLANDHRYDGLKIYGNNYAAKIYLELLRTNEPLDQKQLRLQMAAIGHDTTFGMLTLYELLLRELFENHR